MRSRLATSAEWRAVVSATLESMGVAGWELDLATGHVWWSENMGPMAGLPHGHQPRDYAESASVYEPIPGHPDTLEEARKFFVGSERGESERRAILPDGSTRWTRHQYSVTHDDAGRPVHAFGLVTDIENSRRRADEERFLGEASRILGQSLNIEDTLAAVADLMVPHIADWCAVELLRDGRLEPVVTAHRDPEKARWGAAIQADYPPDMNSDQGTPAVVRTGESRFYPEVTDEMILEAAGEDERLLEVLRQVGYRSVIMVPLRTPSHVLGALTLVSAESRRRFDDQTLRFAEDLALRIAVAIQHADLHHELRTVARHLSRLQAATSELSRAMGEQEVAALTVAAGMETGEADRAFIVVVGETPVRVEHSHGVDSVDLHAWTCTGGAAMVAATRREPVFVESAEAMAREFPDTARGAPGAAWACLPVTEDGHAVLVLVYDQPRMFTPGERATLAALAEQASVALDRSRLVAHHRATAHTLQRGLMPPAMPMVEGIESHAVYEASGAAEAGGDWYDLIPLPDGGIAAMIGDTVGHGIPTVATMARLRHVLAAYLHDGMGPAAAIAATNRSAMDMVEARHRFATTVVATIDVEHRRLTMAIAGHPSPVLVSPSGVRLLEEPRGMALGVERTATWPEITLDLDGESLLLLYTDGWIDHPGSDYERQSQILLDLVSASPRRPHAVLESLRHRFRYRPDRDDAAALAIRIP